MLLVDGEIIESASVENNFFVFSRLGVRTSLPILSFIVHHISYQYISLYKLDH
jgi:hypothetical protein